MEIGVLGAGRMAEGLVPRWLAAGHEVMIGGRTPAKTRELAEGLGARHGTLREAAEFGEAIFLAVLQAGLDATLAAAGAADGALRGKTLVECTNAIDLDTLVVNTTPGSSLSQRIAAASGAPVAKAFNLVHYDVYRRSARFHGEPLMVPMAGDDQAKAVAAELIRAAGAEPTDVGGLEHTHELEAMAATTIRLLFGGADPLTAFQLMTGTASGAA